MTDAAKWLKQNGHINDEYVVGISMWAGENHGTHQDPVSVKFLVSSLDGYASIPEKLESSSAPLGSSELTCPWQTSSPCSSALRLHFQVEACLKASSSLMSEAGANNSFKPTPLRGAA